MSDECDLYFLLYIAFKNWLKTQACYWLINCPRQCHGKSQQLRQYHCLSDKKKRKILRICLVSAEFSGPSFQFSWLKTFFRWISLISLCFLSVFLSLFCFLRIFCQFVLWAISLHFNVIIYFSVNQGLNSKDLRANGFSDGLWQHVIFEGFCGFIHAIFQETSTIKNWRIPSGPNTSTHFFF